jgi:hypothetical protein
VPPVGKDELANAIIMIVRFLTKIFQRKAMATSPYNEVTSAVICEPTRCASRDSRQLYKALLAGNGF